MLGRLVSVACAAVVLLQLVCSGVAQAQQADPKLMEEIQALKKGHEEMKKQLQEIKQLLQSRQAGPDVRNVSIDLGDHPTKGDETAKLVLIEFSDYQCPFCARHIKDTDPQIGKEFVDTGKLRYAFFDMPLESMHKSAFKAAEAVRCAGAQGRFWEMHYLLFGNQSKLEPFVEHAKALGLNVPEFEACLTSGTNAAAVRADMAVAAKLGITGTPCFVLAVADPKDHKKVKGLSLLRGAQPFNAFKAEIEKALASLEVDTPK